MKTPSFILSICLLAVALLGCSAQQTALPQETNALPLETPLSISASSPLFADAKSNRILPEEPHISRWRFVKVNGGQLLDESRGSYKAKEASFNLFLDLEINHFTMVYTSGVFMGHFASPLGVYEAVYVEDGLYRVIQIDQTEFQGGEG